MLVEEKVVTESPFSVNTPKDFSLSREKRLTHKSHFDALFLNARRFEGQYLRIYAAPKQQLQACWGVVTNKKVGKAVQRNKVRRRLKEIIRLHQHQLPNNLDLVLFAKSHIKNADYVTIESDLIETLKRKKLMDCQ